MRLKQIRGLPVIDPTAARKIGTVVDYQVDPVAGRIAALDVTPVNGAEGERILAQRIRRVGTNAIILTAHGGNVASAPVEIVDRWLDTSTTIGLEVIGDDGVRIGHLVDATFDQDSLEIDSYSLRTSLTERLMGAPGHIQPDKVHSCSRELMMVSTGRVKGAEAELPAEEAPPSLDEPPTTSLEMPMRLKKADRLPSSRYDAARDGKTVASPR